MKTGFNANKRHSFFFLLIPFFSMFVKKNQPAWGTDMPMGTDYAERVEDHPLYGLGVSGCVQEME